MSHPERCNVCGGKIALCGGCKVSETEAAIKALRKTGYDPTIKSPGKCNRIKKWIVTLCALLSVSAYGQQCCIQSGTCQPWNPILGPCAQSCVCPAPTPIPTPTPTPTPKPQTWGFDPGMTKPCVKGLGTDRQTYDIGYSCTPNFLVLNIAREALVNAVPTRLPDPKSDVKLSTTLIPGGYSAKIDVTGGTTPVPNFTWASFGEHIYYGGTSSILYINGPLVVNAQIKAPIRSGVSRIAVGIGYEYGGKSWQLEANLVTSPEWGDPDPRPGIIFIAPPTMFDSYFAMLDAKHYGYPTVTSDWQSYSIDFRALMSSIVDDKFPVPGGPPKLVSVSVMAEGREGSKTSFEVSKLAVYTSQPSSPVPPEEPTPEPMDTTWQIPPDKIHHLYVYCVNGPCVVRLFDGHSATDHSIEPGKRASFTVKATGTSGAATVYGQAWSGLSRQGYSSEEVCTPLLPMVSYDKVVIP